MKVSLFERFTDVCNAHCAMMTMIVLVMIMMMLMLMITCLEAATICLRKNLSLVVMHRMMNILSLITIFIVMLMMMLIMVIMMVMMLMVMMFANPIYTESVCLLSPGGGIRQPVGTHSLADKNIINIIIIIIIINLIVIININVTKY